MTEIEPADDEALGRETRASRKEDAKSEPVEAELIPEDVQDAIVQRLAMKMEQYSSPHPHPEHLERYAALYPDAPRIVFESFNEQGQHRREMETMYMKGSERRATIGQWLAFVLVAGAIAGGAYAFSKGFEWAGGVVIVAALGGGIVLAISGSRQEPAPAARKNPGTRRRQTNGELVAKPREPDAPTGGAPEAPPSIP